MVKAKMALPQHMAGKDFFDKVRPPASAGRGFLNMTPERRREIASMGGKAAHAKGTAHQFTSATALEAGRLSHIAKMNKAKGL